MLFSRTFSTVIATVALSVFAFCAHQNLKADTFNPEATLFPAYPGTIPFGSDFGATVKLNGDFLFVADANSITDTGKSFAGAVYVYKRKDNAWVGTQIIRTGGLEDSVGFLTIDSQEDYLLISATETPLGNSNAPKDFRGAVLVFRLNKEKDLWELKQTLDSNTEGLHSLTPAAPPNTPPRAFLSVEQGANFGLFFSMDIKKGVLLVGAEYQIHSNIQGLPVPNSGTVFAFKLDKESGKFKLTQKILSPEKILVGGTFGYNVKVKGDIALISNGSVSTVVKSFNGTVYVYQLVDNKWEFIQQLTSKQKNPTHVVYPPNLHRTLGDSFGASLAFDGKWAMIGSPFESKNALELLKGAVYFYELVEEHGEKKFVKRQRVFSNDPTAQLTSLFHLAIDRDTALISDPGRLGPKSQICQGGIMVFKRTKDSWEHIKTLFDPNGVAFNCFGTGVDLNDKFIVGGSSSSATSYHKNFSTFSSIQTGPFIAPNPDVVIFSRD